MAKSVKYNKANLESTIEAALKLVTKENPAFIIPSYYGYQITFNEKPKRIDFIKVSPGKIEKFEYDYKTMLYNIKVIKEKVLNVQ